MIYVVAWLFPPLALLIKGKIFQSFFCFLLWIIGVCLLFVGAGIIPLIACIIWACAVVAGANADKRQEKLIQAIRESQIKTAGGRQES